MPTSAALHVRGLWDFWARRSMRVVGPGPLDQRDRLLCDLLGLGLEQTFRHLATERPDYLAFLRWAQQLGEGPDPVAVARYDAWLDGTSPPAEVQAALAAVDALPPVFTGADLAHWDRYGWITLPQAISAKAAAAAADLLWDCVRGNPHDPSSWYDGARQGIMVQQFQHPAQTGARYSPRMHKAFAQLWGTTDLWVAVDRMSFNPPETPSCPFQGTPLHWDVSLALPIPFATQAILYLTDTAPDQGALRLVPGFHHRIERWLAELGNQDPRAVDLSSETISIGGAAGDLVIWRQDLPHGASPNRSNRPRLAQYVNFYSPDLRQHADWC